MLESCLVRPNAFAKMQGLERRMSILAGPRQRGIPEGDREGKKFPACPVEMCGPCLRCSSQVNFQQQRAVILRSNASATYRFLRFDGYFGAVQYAAARLHGDLP